MPRFDQKILELAVAKSTSFAEVARNLKMCVTGGNHITIKKYVGLWNINTEHFLKPSEIAKKFLGKPAKPLKEILVENSFYNRTNLKHRLYQEGLKKPICELCGQTEVWQGKHISLILDHINGIRNDNRLQNLRVLCPNCNATLDTHCGKQAKNKCLGCSNLKSKKRKYCSKDCYLSNKNQSLKPEKRKVKRPKLKILQKELSETNYVAVSKKYGVSDNAVRKWLKMYEKYGE